MTLPDPSIQDHRIETPRGRLFARSWTVDSSEGTAPVVLLHDSLGSVALWRDFPGVLAQAAGRRVIAYDRLGFGQSDAHPGPIETDFIRTEAQRGFAAIRKALAIDDFVILGHSVGGGMATWIASDFGESCRALITESAQAFVEDRTLQGIRDAERGFAEPGQIERLARYHGDKARWVLDSWVQSWLSPIFADWRLDGSEIRPVCPVLAIHGEADEFGSPIHAERIAALTSGPATAHIITGCGHVPHRERETEVTALFTTFLAAI